MVPPNRNEAYSDNDRTWESLLKISEEAQTTESIEEFVATIHDILADLVIAKNFFIALYDETTGKYFFPYFKDEFDSIETTGVSYVYDESLEMTQYELSGTLTDYVRTTGKPIRFPNERITELYQSGKISLFGSQSVSWLGVPLKFQGKTGGVMVLQSYEIEGAYKGKDEELMVFVSDHIARAIENVRAEERIRKQHTLVLQQKQAITDSITYARRIQKAVLPSAAYLGNILPEHFTIYQPKDILGGDFYWAREIEGHKVIIVADCTGHGVPGALMSMLGVTLLNEQFRTFGIRPPAEILGKLRVKVKEILAQEGNVDEQKDGMDMAIAILNREKNELQFAGANIPLYLVRAKMHVQNLESEQGSSHGGDPGSSPESDPGSPLVTDPGPSPGNELRLSLESEEHELYRINGDRQPIGVYWEEADFTNHVVSLQEWNSLYMFTDGIVDQYGGKKRKKFKSKRLKKLLLTLQGEPMEVQGKRIIEAFEDWRGNCEQIDDVCVVGVRQHWK